MRGTLLGFVFTGKYNSSYANLRPGLCLYATTRKNQIRLAVPTVADMEDVGGLLATITLFSNDDDDDDDEDDIHDDFAKGRILFLHGDLGTGKTAFSRGFIRAATGIPDLRVTSPTYLLSNTYRAATSPPIEIHHMDLYRLSGTSEAEFTPINLPHVFSSCLSLVEWPVRLPATLVPHGRRLDVTLRIVSGETPSYSAGDDEDDESATRVVCIESDDSRWSMKIEKLRSEGLLDDLLIEEPCNF